MTRPDEDTLKALVKIDKSIYKWLRDSIEDHIDTIASTDPDKNAKMRDDLISKVCELREIVKAIDEARGTLATVQKNAEKEDDVKQRVF